MHNRKWLLTLVLVLGLAVTLAACGGEPEPASPEAPTQAPAAQATSAPAVEPTDTPVPTEPPAPTEAPAPTEPEEDLEIDLDDLAEPSQFSSYRSSMRMAVSGTSEGEQVEGEFSFLIEYVADPPAQHIIISGQDFAGAEEMGEIEMYQVEDTTYMKFGEEWLSMPSTEDVLGDAGVMNPDDIVGDTCGWQSQGTTEYNGVRARHWTLSQEDLEACMTAQDLAEIGEIEEASGELYIAVEENYIVYMDIVFSGQNMGFDLGTDGGTVDDGSIEITFEMTDVNEPIDIELPEEAAASGSLPEDIPVPADAEEVGNMFGMITFNSPSTPEQVAEFYQAEMPNNGWTEVSFEEMSGLYMAEYTKDSRSASLMINTDDETGLTSVLITIADENEG